jgi:Trk K+ transport system NAD-binding subunit
VHVIVVGCGRVGSGLAVSLSASFNGKTLVGSGFDRDILYQADANNADALAAVTSGDNTNILTVRIARENYKIPNVVARIYDPRRAEIYQRLGIPTVATVTWTIDQVRRRLLPDRDVTRAGVPRLDGRELIGQEGDVLHIAVLDDALRQFDELLARTSGRAQDGGK